MAIPTVGEIARLIPALLSEGQVYKSKEITEIVKKHLIETKVVDQKDLEERIESGIPKLDHRVGWAIHRLFSQGKLERTEKATYRLISGAGKEEHREEKSSSHIAEEQSPEEAMRIVYKSITETLKLRLLNLLRREEFDFDKFERVVLELLKRMGYGEPVETKRTRDEGIDGIVKGDKLGIEEIYIQAKRWNERNVGADVINNFIGALARKGGNKGVIITTSDFTSEAYKAVEEVKSGGTKIVLINGDKLANLMIEYGVGVYTRYTYEIKDIDENFFEEV